MLSFKILILRKYMLLCLRNASAVFMPAIKSRNLKLRIWRRNFDSFAKSLRVDGNFNCDKNKPTASYESRLELGFKMKMQEDASELLQAILNRLRDSIQNAHHISSLMAGIEPDAKNPRSSTLYFNLKLKVFMHAKRAVLRALQLIYFACGRSDCSGKRNSKISKR